MSDETRQAEHAQALPGPVRFQWQVIRAAPRAAWDALSWYGNGLFIVLGVLFLLNRKVAAQVSNWHGFSPWWALVPFGVLVLIGLLRANYDRFKELHEAYNNERELRVALEAENKKLIGA